MVDHIPVLESLEPPSEVGALADSSHTYKVKDLLPAEEAPCTRVVCLM